MKNLKENDDLPKGMEDIKSGRIFEVPPGYFDQLSKQLFDQNDHPEPVAIRSFKIKSLVPWLAAASIAALITLAWWITTDVSVTTDNNVATESQLGEYIQQEIMEYDLETLSLNLNHEDLHSLKRDEPNPYKKYIEEHFEDFDEILY